MVDYDMLKAAIRSYADEAGMPADAQARKTFSYNCFMKLSEDPRFSRTSSKEYDKAFDEIIPKFPSE